MEGPEVTFLFQFGNLRDMVTVPASTINLRSLKDLACDFINSKVSLFYFSFNWSSFKENNKFKKNKHQLFECLDTREWFEPFIGAIAIISAWLQKFEYFAIGEFGGWCNWWNTHWNRVDFISWVLSSFNKLHILFHWHWHSKFYIIIDLFSIVFFLFYRSYSFTF